MKFTGADAFPIMGEMQNILLNVKCYDDSAWVVWEKPTVRVCADGELIYHKQEQRHCLLKLK